MKRFFLTLAVLMSYMGFSQHGMDAEIAAIESKVIEWRRHFHQNPELSNREFKTLYFEYNIDTYA